MPTYTHHKHLKVGSLVYDYRHPVPRNVYRITMFYADTNFVYLEPVITHKIVYQFRITAICWLQPAEPEDLL